MKRPARTLAGVLAGGAVLAPLHSHANPPKPAHHSQAPQNARVRAYGPGGYQHPPEPRTGAVGSTVKRQGPSWGLAGEAERAHKAGQPYREHVKAAAKAHGLDGHTLEALLYKESGFDAKAYHKRTKARGVSQFVPSGAAAVGRMQRARGATDWFTYAKTLDPVASIHAAAELLAFGLELCGGLAEAIRMYNTGKCGRPNAFSRAVTRLAAAIRFVTEIEEPRS